MEKALIKARYHFSCTIAEYRHASANHVGLCSACGDDAESCEPDCRDRRCETCGQFAVCGLEELMLCGDLIVG